MGQIAQALMKADYLAPVAEAFNKYVQKQQEERDMKALLGFRDEFSGNVKDIYNESQPQDINIGGNSLIPSMQSFQTPGASPEQVNQRLADNLFNYQGQLQGLESVSPTDVNNQVSALKTLTSAYTPKPKEKVEQFTLGEGGMRFDENGNVIAENPKEIKPGKDLETELILKNKYEKEMVDYKDSIDDENRAEKEKYEKEKEKAKGTSDTKERGKLRSKVGQAIRNIENLKRQGYKGKEIETEEKDDDGNPIISRVYQAVDSDGVKTFENTDQFTEYKEAVKQKSMEYVNRLITDNGLQEGVEVVRAGLKKGKSLDEVIKAFKEANPDWSGDDIDDLRTYFKFHKL